MREPAESRALWGEPTVPAGLRHISVPSWASDRVPDKATHSGQGCRQSGGYESRQKRSCLETWSLTAGRETKPGTSSDAGPAHLAWSLGSGKLTEELGPSRETVAGQDQQEEETADPLAKALELQLQGWEKAKSAAHPTVKKLSLPP